MNISAFLAAIAMVETGANDHKVGTLGEISRYQVRPFIWTVYSRRLQNPCTYCHHCGFYVASKHLASNSSFLTKRFDSVWWNAVAWNWGVCRTTIAKGPNDVPKSVREYANRVENLYNEYNKTATRNLDLRHVSGKTGHNKVAKTSHKGGTDNRRTYRKNSR